MKNLGHNSKAVHRAYAKRALMKIFDRYSHIRFYKLMIFYRWKTTLIVVGLVVTSHVGLAQQPVGSLVITGKPPIVVMQSPPVGSLILTGKKPVSSPPAGALSLTGRPPVINVFNNLQASDLVLMEGEEVQVKNSLSTAISDLVDKKEFAALDQMADKLRTSKLQISNGLWHLLVFYNLLTYDYDHTEKDESDKKWHDRLEFLNAWVSARPASITARIALARFYTSYAWKARGTGWANTVTDQGWQLFEERLQLALKTLIEAKTITAKCPVWADTMETVAMGQRWTHKAFNTIFDEAVAAEPNYIGYYYNKVLYLLPRWEGQEGEWQKFATESADKLGGEAGNILYARIGWRAHYRGYCQEFLRDSGYSWIRLRDGLEKIVNQNPNSISAANELAYLACQKKDPCAKQMFERIGRNMDTQVWGDYKARFLICRMWALSCPQPSS